MKLFRVWLLWEETYASSRAVAISASSLQYSNCCCSAGGTGVLLNVDRVAEQLEEMGYQGIQVRGLADSGWFLDNKQYRRTDCIDTITCAPTEAIRRGIRYSHVLWSVLLWRSVWEDVLLCLPAFGHLKSVCYITSVVSSGILYLKYRHMKESVQLAAYNALTVQSRKSFASSKLAL